MQQNYPHIEYRPAEFKCRCGAFFMSQKALNAHGYNKCIQFNSSQRSRSNPGLSLDTSTRKQSKSNTQHIARGSKGSELSNDYWETLIKTMAPFVHFQRSINLSLGSFRRIDSSELGLFTSTDSSDIPMLHYQRWKGMIHRLTEPAFSSKGREKILFFTNQLHKHDLWNIASKELSIGKLYPDNSDVEFLYDITEPFVITEEQAAQVLLSMK